MISRRESLQGMVATIASCLATSNARAVDEKTPLPELLVRGESPLNAETPASLLDTYLTPNDRFFVRSHFGPPLSTVRDRELTVTGMVKTPLRLLDLEVRRLEQVTLPAVLQCSGNGRAFFQPTVPGVGWERGAVGNAEWTGVRLRDLLEKAGIDSRAKHIQFVGNDAPPHPKTPAFHRSLPIERAMDPSTLVAYGMNGPAMPRLHGGPFRLIVPGWAGNHWIKWLSEIKAAQDESPGFYQQTGYKMPKTPAPPGAILRPQDLTPVTALNVKSLIVAPAAGAMLRQGIAAFSGVAWTGNGRVTKVDISIDGGPWKTAKLHGRDEPGAWRLWRFTTDLAAGPHKVRSRATDSDGDTQPEVTPWNKSGYLWNGIDSVNFEVR